MNALAGEFVSILGDACAALRRELGEIDIINARAGHCTRTALAVTLSVIAALVLRVQAPWWAAISTFVSIQTSAPSSIERGALRVAGTAIGAAVAVLLSPWLIEDQVAISLALFVASAVAVLGLQVSSYGYAFMLGGVTFDMVLLAAIRDPASVLSVACNRAAEVLIGTVVAVLVSIVLSPPVDATDRPSSPGWSDLFGAQWPSVQHALRAGLGVMLVPWVGNFLELPNLSQTAITVAAVMAVQAASSDEVTNQKQVVIRATHRMLGCVVGGTIGLAVLSFLSASFLAWLFVLGAGAWFGTFVQNSKRGIGYVGTQGAVVFIMTLVQGFGPPESIVVGMERFAGITGGLAITLAVSVLTADQK